ncbi:MAG: GNAT family N-acetyltransferase [Desulfobulbaceae bacterium]|nr:GNAT family N-acetyltransferase [Desulfobulbaceae bacterium]
MTQIRQAATGDIPSLLPMVEGYWNFENIPGFEPGRVAVQLARLFSEPGLGNGWIVFSDAAVGYLLAVYVFSLEHFGLTAEIDELFVLPSHRGGNIGSALLKTAELEFVRAGCTNVSLQLAHGNDSARAFYHRHGYMERSGFELLDKVLHDR